MSADNLIYLKKSRNKFFVWGSSASNDFDNGKVPKHAKKFDSFNEAMDYANELETTTVVEYGIHCIGCGTLTANKKNERKIELEKICRNILRLVDDQPLVIGFKDPKEVKKMLKSEIKKYFREVIKEGV